MGKNLKDIFQRGFTLLEIMVVLAIMAVLLAMAGLSFLSTQRNNLLLEQAVQDLAGEIRLVQSKAMAVQEVQIGPSIFIPKAVIVKIANNSDPEVYYLRNCNDSIGILDKKIKILDRVSSLSVLFPNSSPIYLIYNSPLGKFYLVSNFSTFPSFIESSNNSCIPQAFTNISRDINIILSNNTKTYNIFIDEKSGGVTISP